MPLSDIDPRHVRLEHIHAAVSRWFDGTLAEHRANDKPYAISPLSGGTPDTVGMEVAALTREAEERFREHTASGGQIKLGHQIGRIGQPFPLHAQTWQELAAPSTGRHWRLEFVTPTTFRSGDRSSPLPTVLTIISGLAENWRWARQDVPQIILPDAELANRHLWVSDLDLRSQVLRLQVRSRAAGEPRQITISGVIGHLNLRSSSAEAADAAAALLRLAAYGGVGAMTRRGLGLTRVTPGPSAAPSVGHGLAG